MPEISADHFLMIWRQSLGIGPEEFELTRAACQEANVHDNLDALTDFLRRNDQLTEWQLDRLRAGRPIRMFIGKYRLLGPLGTGGMGKVFLGDQKLLNRRVAIKVLRRGRMQDKYIQRFVREARAAASLDHRNIVRVIDFDKDGERFFLVMEYVDGIDLRAKVQQDGPLPLGSVADCIAQAADGLHYAHEAGFVHRDVKPANLLIDKRQTVKISDLGLARWHNDDEASLTLASEKALGTVDFLAPEQARDSHDVDRRADLYGLGCTLYFLATGDVPFPEGNVAQKLRQHFQAVPPDLRQRRPDCPAPLQQLLRRLLAKEPCDRPSTACEVAAELRQLATHLSSLPTAPPVSLMPRQQTPPAISSRPQKPRLDTVIPIAEAATPADSSESGLSWPAELGRPSAVANPASSSFPSLDLADTDDIQLEDTAGSQAPIRASSAPPHDSNEELLHAVLPKAPESTWERRRRRDQVATKPPWLFWGLFVILLAIAVALAMQLW
ncbi:MAG: protein kinase [Planctomycetales bacterium]|nr:protein kinase [Planctomycetales bacterium]